MPLFGAVMKSNLFLRWSGTGMNGQPKVVVTTADEQTSIVYPNPRASIPMASSRSSMDSGVNGGGYQSQSIAQSANGRYYNKYHRRHSSKKKHSTLEHSVVGPTAAINGTVLSLSSSKDNSKLLNGRGRSNSSALDPLSDEIERRSVLHYDIGYYEKSHTGCIRGTLTFALRYDYIHRVLMVHLIRANHLTDKVRDAF